MARSRGFEYQDEGEAKPDTYLGLVIVSFFTTLLATIIMWWEFSSLSS